MEGLLEVLEASAWDWFLLNLCPRGLGTEEIICEWVS